MTDDTIYPKHFTIYSKDALKITLKLADKEENKEAEDDIVLEVEGQLL